MKAFFEKVRQARRTVAGYDSAKVILVQGALAAYTEEAAKLDDDLGFIGHPEAVKRDFLVGAIIDGRMTEEEFEELFAALDIIQTSQIAC